MAEALGLAAVAQDPADLWAVHAVAHVLEMQGRFEDGVGWLSERVELSKAGSFANHLFWHEALYRLELGRTAEVLYLFDSHVYANSSEEGLDLSNAVSLLARLEIVGVDAGDRWNRLAGPCAARLAQHSHPFNDAHFALALARSGSTDTLARLLGSMAEWAERDTDAARTLRRCGLSVALGMAAYGEGRFAEAVQVLAPVRYETWQLGGSLAQLDVFAQILIAAAVGAGQLTLAARLLAERTARRPASPLGWVWEAQVSGRIGDEERAARATERAARLR